MVENYSKSKCHIRTLLGCLSARATPEVCHMQCNEIVTEQSVSVCGTTSVLLQTVGWSIIRGCGTANRCLTSRSMLYTKAGASCFVLAKGPSNGSVMAWQTMLFGTVVKRGRFFTGLPSADDSTGYSGFSIIRKAWYH